MRPEFDATNLSPAVAALMRERADRLWFVDARPEWSGYLQRERAEAAASRLRSNGRNVNIYPPVKESV